MEIGQHVGAKARRQGNMFIAKHAGADRRGYVIAGALKRFVYALALALFIVIHTGTKPSNFWASDSIDMTNRL